MFWGLIMEPNKRYTQTVEKPFHISQAAMDISTGDNDPCQVMVVVDQKNFLVCTLQKGKAIQVPLDLYFKAGASVAFLTNGKCNVHLTGYLDPEFEDDESEGDEEAEEEEEEAAPTLVPAKNKRKLDNSSDAVATKKAKKQATKKAAAELASDSSDEDVDNNLQKFLTEDVDSDENDESFKVNTSTELDSSDEEDSDDDEAEEEEEEDDDEEDEDEEQDSKAETTLDSSLDTSKSEEKKLSKSQKRRLKKKEKQQQAQVNGVEKGKKAEKPDGQQKKGEKKQQEGKKQKDPEVKAGEKREKKTLAGGVYIEDLKVGDGPVAKSGKTVQVYYEGRLKQNNKMFDNCNKGAGFKFRLGSKEVITGWDVGVAGMKVGGKRKIVCPPAMGYGAKGSPPVIPPNSTLVFEVELKNVK